MLAVMKLWKYVTMPRYEINDPLLQKLGQYNIRNANAELVKVMRLWLSNIILSHKMAGLVRNPERCKEADDAELHFAWISIMQLLL